MSLGSPMMSRTNKAVVVSNCPFGDLDAPSEWTTWVCLLMFRFFVGLWEGLPPRSSFGLKSSSDVFISSTVAFTSQVAVLRHQHFSFVCHRILMLGCCLFLFLTPNRIYRFSTLSIAGCSSSSAPLGCWFSVLIVLNCLRRWRLHMPGTLDQLYRLCLLCPSPTSPWPLMLQRASSRIMLNDRGERGSPCTNPLFSISCSPCCSHVTRVHVCEQCDYLFWDSV